MEMARRLKSHAADKARTDAWREQNELIRATFSEVESETLPASLCLAAPVRLRCVANDGLPVNAPAAEKPGFINELNRQRTRIFAISALVIGASVAGAWIVLGHPSAVTDRPTSAASRDLDNSLAVRAMEAMAGVTATPPRQANGLPAVTIPDLTSSGFTFIGVSTQQMDPPALMLFYEDGAAQRIVIGVAKTGPANKTSPTNKTGPANKTNQPNWPVSAPNRHAVVWHTSGHTFALTGTIAQNRLNDIAASLQTSLGSAAKAN